MKKLLLVIDMQVDFVTGALGTQEAAAVVEPVRKKIATCREAGDFVWFTMDTHLESDYAAQAPSREAVVIPKHCLKNTPGWSIVPELQPQDGDLLIEKPSFLSIDLPRLIREKLGEDVALELCGVCTDICVVSNALQLRGAFPHSVIQVNSSCCAGTTPQNHQAALAVLSSCLVDVVQ